MAEKIKQGILVPGEYEDISGERQNKEFSFILLRPDDDEALLSAGMEIVFVLMGRGTFLEMNTEIAHTIREGDIFVINSFSMRRLVLEEGGMAMILKLSPYFIRSVSPETPDPYINCKSFLYDQDRQEDFNIVRRDFAQAFNAYYKNNSGHSAYIRVKLTALLGDLIRFFAEEPPQKRNDTGKERIRTAVDYILRRFRENITLDDLAAATYLSKTYISHSFQKYLGISFTGYLTLVRLMNAEVLLQGDATVTEVAYESGFASANAMIKAFKQYRKMTPGAYRRHFLKERAEARPPAPMSETGFSNVFSSLMRYMDGDSSEEAFLQKNACELCVDLREPGKPYNNHWRMVINAGYAKDVMNGTLQEQIKMIQSCIGFKYIRIKGIMDDDMGVYIRDMLGQLAVNFTYVDAVIDFILSAGALPMIELSHMPSELAAHHKRLSMRSIYWAPAKDLERWAALIGELMEHLAQRYGMARLEKWLFIPWIPPSTANNEDAISAEKSGLHYQAAYKAIKAVSPRIKVCGPGGEI